jgi:hypothetical protein
MKYLGKQQVVYLQIGDERFLEQNCRFYSLLFPIITTLMLCSLSSERDMNGSIY